ncbi:MAG: Protein TolB [Phycisphaerae bacterium]|nr:Protein TolB [Phycisphaerae bacterium]
MTRQNFLSTGWWCGALCSVVLMATGCQMMQKSEPVEQTAELPPPPPRPELVAGGDPAITLFGEIPAVPTEDYEARAAVSLRQHSFPPEGSDFDPAIARNGRQLIFSSTRHALTPDVYIKDVDGVAVTQLTTDPASDIQPCLSPDGRRFAFASDRSGNWDIWIMNIDGQQPIQVTTSEAHEVHPTWSPDGKYLAFCSMPERGGQWELWLASAEAGAVKKFIGYGLFPDFAPKTNTLLYQRARKRGSRWFSLWTLKIVDGEPRLPTEILSSAEYAMILPAWSPDEKQIAYVAVSNVPSVVQGSRNPLQQADIWMVDTDGRGQVRLTDGLGANYAPTWSKEGRIFFTSDRGGGSREAVWSVIPLRGPMGPLQQENNELFSKTDEDRADYVRDNDTKEGRVETVGWPNAENPEE